MYIKQVIIQGFKSYREQTVLEPFDKRHNVVVGRNGSGKSNFFHAIQFVLSDEFSHLRPEQRLALLHEGAGPRVISAFVEIIFDNSDNRIPIEREEIFLRRVIGSKKDQFFLNKKLVPRSEVVNLLETAGLSSSNPYYIVKQGKINQMATAPDSHRLKLLREVAGTRVYDERREESISILNQAVGKVDKINEFLQTIEERLQTLEEETKELKEYQKWDKARRLLEFIIHDTEHKENTKRLEELEQQRSSGSKERQQLVNQVKEAQENVREANKLVKAARAEVAATREERDVLLTEQHQLQQERSRLELGIRDLERDVRADDAAKDKAENELDRVRKQISEVKRELEELKPKYEEMKTREEEISRELSLDQQKRRELIARQGRGTQFTSKHDRDVWIERELVSLNKQIKDKREHERKLREELDRDEKNIAELEKKMEETGVEIERQRVTINKLQEQHYECKKKKDLEQSTRNELWRKETSLTHKLSSLREDLSKAERALCATAGKAILNGCASVRTVVQTFREKGGEWADVAARYHGLVVENFTCDRAMYTAVEMTAGNRLFHHIVESDSVGTAILREMNRQGLPGEVTFMPLNRLRVRDYVYPRDENAIVMISKLQYGAQHASCMKYIFGKSLVCRSLRAAAALGRQFNLDCVTLEGDQVSSKGPLTGGYINQSRSRLEMQKTRSSLLEQISSLEEELAILKLQLHSTESSINNIVSDMQRAETKQGKARDIFDKVQAALRLMREELASLTGLRGPRERALERTCSSLEQMLATRDGLQAERRQDLMSQLSSAEQQELEELTAAIRRLTRENEDAFSTRLQLEAHKNKRESLLTNNLIRRESELLQALAEISSSDRERGLSVLKSELRAAESRASQLAAAAELAGKRLGAARASETHAGLQLERWTNKEKEAQEKLEEDTKDLEKMAAKEVLLQEKIQESLDKMAALGSVPGAPELRATYNNMSVSQLFKELEKVNHHLKEYSHVNLKALDQLNRFSDQKERLYRRKEELDVGGEKIRSLIEILESRKLEAIEFTFKQVSKYFTDVLQRLAPRASGQLVMRLATDGDSPPQRSQRFVGVGARVSFCGGDMRDLNQLSGGQKTLVALALIFAIQKADPAPFYLFDEIDQALDSSHRAAIADMIQELSSSAQFITTTFRPELLEHAHKFYGVKFRNKVSHVECVTREEAMNFVEDGAAVMPV